MDTAKSQFETVISRLIEPLNGQYPRPWMTDSTNPLSASLFIVGKNQANGYGVGRLTHQRHLDSLFNRAGESCRRVYEEMTGLSPSPTRVNTNRFRAILEKEGITGILETNVVCYSTPMSSDLGLPQHTGGTARGTDIFRTLLHFVRPKVLIAHGSGTRDTLGRLLGAPLPAPPTTLTEPLAVPVKGMRVFVIPSLAPPQWNQWSSWAEPYLTKVAKAAARYDVASP
jgi:hypothetical protein